MPLKPQNSNIEDLKKTISLLPNQPGVYQYFDKTDKIIYVGKAKDLKKRVSSYFTGTIENRKTWLLVKNIYKIRYLVVSSEQDALLLENSLIKKYQPRYNVRLKDDKSYPWICIKNERFPRVFMTRNVVKDGSKYYGPYSSVYTARILLELFKRLYPLRTCKYNLSKDNVRLRKYSICLEYHIKNCCGPCEDLCSEEEYIGYIAQIKKILKGKTATISRLLKDEMNKASENLKFEEAMEFKNKLEVLEKYQSRSTVVSPSIGDIDVFSIVTDDDCAYINYLKVLNGSIVNTFTQEIQKVLDESENDLLLMGITELRQKFKSHTKDIIVPFEIEQEGSELNYFVPKIGDKLKLLDLSKRNTMYYRKEKLQSQLTSRSDKKSGRDELLLKIKEDLRLSSLPTHIECFDNSNIQGTNPVAACVVFKNGKPSGKDYRHFKIKTVDGPDDFASMEEVVYRRYKRLLDEKQSLPQLIVIDGGKGQLKSALKSLDKLGLRGSIAIIGIAKKLEEIYFPGDSIPIYLDKRSQTLKVIQRLRDEAHRFGITFHRNLRSKDFAQSELVKIKGIGKDTAMKLLKKYKSIMLLSTASEEELQELIGKNRAKLLRAWLNETAML
ncbi:MAG: excinuclease ABC subunit UvrC [Bacteroidales bacterium]